MIDPHFLHSLRGAIDPRSVIEAPADMAREAAMERGLVQDAVVAKSNAQRIALWRLRESIPQALAAAFLRCSAEVEHGVHDIAHRYGGSFSAEHGIGKYKLGELARYRTSTELDVMRALKQALDPKGIMNPGKVLK
jgi:FAD/FMN-containing dehydrogenase